eukprot:6200113-Pleurochrysis_carterae.AAC.3
MGHPQMRIGVEYPQICQRASRRRSRISQEAFGGFDGFEDEAADEFDEATGECPHAECSDVTHT